MSLRTFLFGGAADPQPFEVAGDGNYSIEIVGESHYQSALRACVPGIGYVRHDCTAHLVCEDDNPYDDNAVRVDVDGLPVGYLSRAKAAAYRGFLRDNGLGTSTGIVRARIYGGGGKSYGIWLDIA